MGSFCFDAEHIIEFIADARHRFLKPGGKLIPQFAETFVMPVSSDAFGGEVARITCTVCGTLPSATSYFWKVSLVRAYEVPFSTTQPSIGLLSA
jgi:hypothetical protein